MIMHNFIMPDWAASRVKSRRGKVHVFDDMVPAKTALVVVDLQNAFMLDEIAHGVIPESREIVPNVNRLAAAVRETGGVVCWIKMTITDQSLQDRSVFHDVLSTPQLREKRIAALRDPVGHQVYSQLDVQAGDEIVQKTNLSAFIQGSSNIEEVLRRRGIDTVIITGTITNVCCESSARDASMRNFKVIMAHDANACRTEQEHAAALTNFYVVFGDVMSTDEIVACLRRNASAVAPGSRTRAAVA
jgi:ureidoacrylate peracid hydrolase